MSDAFNEFENNDQGEKEIVANNATIETPSVRAASPDEAVKVALQQDRLLGGGGDSVSEDALASAFEQVTQEEYDIDGGKYGILTIVQPEINDTIEARIKYANKKREFEKRGLPSSLEVEQELNERGVWGVAEKERETELRNKINSAQAIVSQLNTKLADNADNEELTQAIRASLEEQINSIDLAMRELSQLREPLESALQDTSDALADMYRWLWFTSRCVMVKATGQPLWASDEDILRAKDDEDTTNIVTLFMRTRLGPPLLRSELWQEEKEKPAESGEKSGE